MKIQIQFKTPDAVDNAIEYLSEDDKELVKDIANKYIEYGELLTVEIDTDNETITVI